MPEAILFSQMTPPPDLEAEFGDWYDHEHVPARLAIPGFLGARRYVAVQADPRYAVTYSLAGLGALHHPAYVRLKDAPSPRTARMLAAVRGFTRYVGEELARHRRPDAPAGPEAAPYLYAVMFAVPPARAAEFDRWYDDEHCPMLLANPHWWQVRRYAIREGTPGPWTHLALHYLADLAALDGPERARARATPWRARLAAEPWFAPQGAIYRGLPPAW
ncbi:MAG: DUF4286 family protein [Armatimonadota bacterium]|nr:DUF4286 family protein [Armatimonadota bacterium]MDR7534190.1 DUF4286 family protein [Armatimonadota bacterium]MDR7537649.1 DUF4286 family protein [Armatimonadota bacterium]